MVPAFNAAAVVARLALAAEFAAFGGCSSSVLGPAGGAGKGGSAGSGSAGSGGAGSGEVAPRCARTALHATVVVHLPNGDLSCSTAPLAFTASTTTWVGRVTSSDATSVVVEGCAPSAPAGDGGARDGGPADAGAPEASCTPATVRIEAHAPDLDLTRFPTGWARVRASVSRFYACQQSLELTTADPTDGSPPQGPAGKLLLAVVDGNGFAFADSPYTVERVPLGCSTAKGCGSPAPDEYAFDFRARSGGDPVRVRMGEALPWEADGAALVARNLRSYQTTVCDDYWNFAYTIVLEPPK